MSFVTVSYIAGPALMLIVLVGGFYLSEIHKYDE